jgi:hypothetical protein
LALAGFGAELTGFGAEVAGFGAEVAGFGAEVAGFGAELTGGRVTRGGTVVRLACIGARLGDLAGAGAGWLGCKPAPLVICRGAMRALGREPRRTSELA